MLNVADPCATEPMPGLALTDSLPLCQISHDKVMMETLRHEEKDGFAIIPSLIDKNLGLNCIFAKCQNCAVREKLKNG